MVTESDDDFTPPKEVAERLFEPFNAELSSFCANLSEAAHAEGLTRSQANVVVCHMLIDCAAMIACRNRRVFLEGEPDPKRWRRVTEAAFNRRKDES